MNPQDRTIEQNSHPVRSLTIGLTRLNIYGYHCSLNMPICQVFHVVIWMRGKLKVQSQIECLGIMC